MQTLPFGTWPSPITAAAVVAAASSPGEVRVSGPDDAPTVLWAESRPDEGGRIQLVRRSPSGDVADLLPEGVSARTRVHEYGGGAWTATVDAVWFCSWDDQRIHRIDLDADGAGPPRPVTPEPAARHADRYADLFVHGDLLLAVRERHVEPDGTPLDEAVNEIVALPADGRGLDGPPEPLVLVSGPDFVAAPRLSPDGTTLAWISWDHPDMPWDATTLSVAPLDRSGTLLALGSVTPVAGGPAESVIQPMWGPDGRLHWLSDRTGWWNLYRLDDTGPTALTALDEEIGTPPWVFAMSRYAFLADGAIAFAATDGGLDHLVVRATDGSLTGVDSPFSELSSICAAGSRVICNGSGFETEAVVAAIDVGDGHLEILEASRDLGLDPSWMSIGRPISFPSGPDGSRTAHALYYPPANADTTGPSDAAPPLLVAIHGGPTAMARAQFHLGKQFWTSRGFAIVDVNYGGSTGFGRHYRELLQGNWGIVDVEDCIAAATFLADQGLADPARLCIRGGSAGGFTVLAALVGSDVFAAGASSYGVADLHALATETHKFESRYLDGLIGPYPDASDRYDERSPINHVDRLETPLIVFQGLEDEVVPPNQSEMIVDALRTKGVPVAYLAFEGEQHGFRRSETVIRVLEAELSFYGAILGFTPADDLPSLDIHNR